MKSIFFILTFGFAALYFGLFAVRLVLGVDAFRSGKKPTLEQVQNRIGIFRLFGLFRSFLWPRHSSLRHKIFLCLVCAYTFVFFNPQAALSTAKQNKDVYCPNGMAYQVEGGHYIRCEDFDEFHFDQYHGRLRKDLYIK